MKFGSRKIAPGIIPTRKIPTHQTPSWEIPPAENSHLEYSHPRQKTLIYQMTGTINRGGG